MSTPNIEFTYEVVYQNKQNRTLTVVYTPTDGESPALPTVRILPYSETDTVESIKALIVQATPMDEWITAYTTAGDTDFAGIQDAADTTAVAATRPSAVAYESTIEDEIRNKSYQIESARQTKEREGMPYTFTGYPDADVIQLRHDGDLINITGNVTKAIAFKLNNSADLIPFQAQSNHTYTLTPDEMIALGIAVTEFRTVLYARQWELKNALKAVADTGDKAAVVAFEVNF